MDVSGKKILIVGMARSGLASAAFLARRGARVKVTEKRAATDLRSEIEQLESLGVEVEAGGHLLESFLTADSIVASPGVPLRIMELQRARQAGVEIISEIELASRFIQGRIIGITGSNGKTTTTTLVGEILSAAHFPVQVGGNIGTPLISLVESSHPSSITVVELSSFQLEAIPTFRPDVAVILNITPDHLDRYDSLDDYARAKINIFSNQAASDYAVLNWEDPRLKRLAPSLRPRVCWFSNSSPVNPGVYFDGRDVVWHAEGKRQQIISQREIQIKGLHNLENITAAASAAMLVGAMPAWIREGVAGFKGVEHRLEPVAEIRGVQFYNDSKATNTDATQKALESFPQGIILILGGRDKAGDFSVLRQLIQQRVSTVILLGEASVKIRSQLEGAAPMRQAVDMEDAVQQACQQAVAGNVVLLAPACASFDMFKNYEHRGKVFKEAVLRLKAAH